VLPFLHLMHSRTNMEEWLLKREVVRRRYPPPIISLAILQSQRGEREAACTMLRDLADRTSDAWRAGVAEVLGNIGCQASR
jgi:hypothetical protein